MNLYCWRHRTNHAVTNGEAERIIQCLIGVYADEVTEDDATCRPHAGERSYEMYPCPIDVLGWSRDGEMYAEFVAGQVECRQANERDARAIA